MYYRSRRANLDSEDDVDHLIDLHNLTFGDTAPMAEFEYGAWWLVYMSDVLTRNTDPIAFAGITQCTEAKNHGYLKRTGVLQSHTGHGLQRRLIRMRESYARKQGWTTIITDTSRDSLPSSNNLIKAGYKLYEPETPWGVPGALYWRKVFDA